MMHGMDMSEMPKANVAAAAPAVHPVLRVATWFTAFTITVVLIYLVARLFAGTDPRVAFHIIGQTLQGGAFWSALVIGIAAQAVDGALGMGYGVTASTFLLSSGASPAVASASTHISKLFTTGVSGISHAKYGNVDRKLFVRLLVPGMAGGMLGVLLVTQIDGHVLKPFISAYLLVIGLYILAKAWRRVRLRNGEPRHAAKLGLFGGFVDAIGGGGWGPVVTSSLVGAGSDPRMTIGSVNFAEFFMTLATAASFTFLAVEGTWPVVAGLVIGGLIAAPFAARICRAISPRVLFVAVGVLITALSAWNIYRALA